MAGLDVLRGFAAAAVMIHHHGQYYDVLYPGRVRLPVDFLAGHFGVELFFIISGFVIFMTIERRPGVWSFAVARATRLLPCFLAALVLATIVLFLAPMPPLLDPPTLRRFLANMTMAPLLLGERVVDLPYWTLTYELVFYAFMAAVMALGRLRSIEWIALAWMAVGMSFTLFADAELHLRMAIVLMVYHSNFFVIGICLYLVHAGRARRLTWFVLVAAIVMSARGGGERAFYAPGTVYLPLTMVFALAVWLATRSGRWMTLQPLVFLGRISYPLYLVHVVLGFEMIRLGVEKGWSTTEGIAAAVAVSLVAAILLHYLIEVPGERLSRLALKGAMAVRP
ncbi:MAG: acyltransferase [Alphaproteobacteria bacterium]|nr:acyltransferase [Alphaproteobacteria bacterium]